MAEHKNGDTAATVDFTEEDLAVCKQAAELAAKAAVDRGSPQSVIQGAVASAIGTIAAQRTEKKAELAV